MQQHLPLAVCAEGCETAEEQSDDEVHTSQVPERREGKTKAINKCTTVYSIETRRSRHGILDVRRVATALTVYGIETQYLQHLLKLSPKLQQHLPPAVLKQEFSTPFIKTIFNSCNNTYRLRY